MFKLKVRALPKDLPEQIIVDVTALEIGKSLHLGDVVAPAGVEILGNKKLTVVSVAAPRAEEEVAPAAADAKGAADVEMTKEKKEEGAEGAAPAKDAKAPAAEAKPEAKKK
jgi:large subunit ribosomal protein L25